MSCEGKGDATDCIGGILHVELHRRNEHEINRYRAPIRNSAGT